MTLEGKEREDKAIERHYQNEEKREEAKKTYLYRHSGLQERHGYVPWWLHAVTIILVIWIIYYLIVYWTPQQPMGLT